MCTLIGLCRKKGSIESRIREDMKSRTRPGYGWLRKAFFPLYQHNWEDRVAKNFQRQLFSSLCHWLSDTRGMLMSSPAFILSTFSSERRFLSRAGPWQAPVYSFNELNSLHRASRKHSELLWRNQPTFIKNNSNKIQRRDMKHINIAQLWLRTSVRTWILESKWYFLPADLEFVFPVQGRHIGQRFTHKDAFAIICHWAAWVYAPPRPLHYLHSGRPVCCAWMFPFN